MENATTTAQLMKELNEFREEAKQQKREFQERQAEFQQKQDEFQQKQNEMTEVTEDEGFGHHGVDQPGRRT